MRILSLIFCLLLVAGMASAQWTTVTDPIRVVDGDTLKLADGERIRIENIDAPESGTAAGETATLELRRLIASGGVSIRRTGVDRYGRTLARVDAGGADVGLTMVATGHAQRWVAHPGGGVLTVVPLNGPSKTVTWKPLPATISTTTGAGGWGRSTTTGLVVSGPLGQTIVSLTNSVGSGGWRQTTSSTWVPPPGSLFGPVTRTTTVGPRGVRHTRTVTLPPLIAD